MHVGGMEREMYYFHFTFHLLKLRITTLRLDVTYGIYNHAKLNRFCIEKHAA